MSLRIFSKGFALNRFEQESSLQRSDAFYELVNSMGYQFHKMENLVYMKAIMNRITMSQLQRTPRVAHMETESENEDDDESQSKPSDRVGITSLEAAMHLFCGKQCRRLLRQYGQEIEVAFTAGCRLWSHQRQCGRDVE